MFYNIWNSKRLISKREIPIKRFGCIRTFLPYHERTSFSHGNSPPDQHLCFCTYIGQSLYFLNPNFQASSHLQRWVQPGLCQIWSNTSKTDYLATRPIYRKQFFHHWCLSIGTSYEQRALPKSLPLYLHIRVDCR